MDSILGVIKEAKRLEMESVHFPLDADVYFRNERTGLYNRIYVDAAALSEVNASVRLHEEAPGSWIEFACHEETVHHVFNLSRPPQNPQGYIKIPSDNTVRVAILNDAILGTVTETHYHDYFSYPLKENNGCVLGVRIPVDASRLVFVDDT